MRIALLESYYGGSHRYWADSLQQLSKHDIELYTMPPRHWKWRMQGSAYYFAENILRSNKDYELFLISDMIDLSLFRSLLSSRYRNSAFVLYMHENQLCYPYSALDKQKDLDLSYGFLNYKSCLSADKVLFNSQYHLKVFLEACRALLNKMPDFKILDSVDSIDDRSSVIPIGLNIDAMNEHRDPTFPRTDHVKRILWNHRWDDDKNPLFFAEFLDELSKDAVSFELILTKQGPYESKIYKEIVNKYEGLILNKDFETSYQAYIGLLRSSDRLFVSPGHDFFGISVLEAIYCGVRPLLPVNAVYHEHLAESEYPGYYYKDLKSLKLIFEKDQMYDRRSIEKQIDRYNWSRIIDSYDSFFSEL